MTWDAGGARKRLTEYKEAWMRKAPRGVNALVKRQTPIKLLTRDEILE